MDDIERADRLLKEAIAELDNIKTYSCVVLCQDRIGGTLRKQERIQSYFRAPRSVYLRWLPGPYEGLQTSYVPERDGEGKFLARETGLKGLVGAVSWASDSPLIDKVYPHHFRTHETSVSFLVRLSVDISNRARELKKMRINKIEELTDPWLKRAATLVDTELSSSSKDGLRWPRTELFFDKETRLPLHFKLHAFDGGLYGEYAFSEFKPNIELKPDAFELKKL